MSQDEIEGLEKLLERPDITYPTPGRRDTVYGDVIQCKRQYKQKRYLMWKIHDLLGIINESKIITNKQYASVSSTVCVFKGT